MKLVLWLSLVVPWVCLRFVIFPDHTHLLFLVPAGKAAHTVVVV